MNDFLFFFLSLMELFRQIYFKNAWTEINWKTGLVNELNVCYFNQFILKHLWLFLYD